MNTRRLSYPINPLIHSCFFIAGYSLSTYKLSTEIRFLFYALHSCLFSQFYLYKFEVKDFRSIFKRPPVLRLDTYTFAWKVPWYIKLYFFKETGKPQPKDPPSPMIRRVKFPSLQFNTSYCLVTFNISIQSFGKFTFLASCLILLNCLIIHLTQQSLVKIFKLSNFIKICGGWNQGGTSAFGEGQKCD